MACGVVRAKLPDGLHCAFYAGVLCQGVLYLSPAAFTENQPPAPQQGGGQQPGQNGRGSSGGRNQPPYQLSNRGGPGGNNRPPSRPSNRGGPGRGGPGGVLRPAGGDPGSNRGGPRGPNQSRPGGPGSQPGIGTSQNGAARLEGHLHQARDQRISSGPGTRSRVMAQYRRSLPGTSRTRHPHFAAGSYLPCTVVPYFTPVPPGVIHSLPPIPPGYGLGYYQGYVAVYDPGTFFILNLIDLLSWLTCSWSRTPALTALTLTRR
jgi:hypothetical protein